MGLNPRAIELYFIFRRSRVCANQPASRYTTSPYQKLESTNLLRKVVWSKSTRELKVQCLISVN